MIFNQAEVIQKAFRKIVEEIHPTTEPHEFSQVWADWATRTAPEHPGLSEWRTSAPGGPKPGRSKDMVSLWTQITLKTERKLLGAKGIATRGSWPYY